MAASDLPIRPFASPAEMESWLEDHHADSEGIWLKIAKKDSGVESVTYAEALEVALCFGWIDGQKRGFDEQHFLQRFTPRRPRGEVVADQPREGRSADRGGHDAPGRARRGRARQGRRALGRGLRGTAHRHGARRPATRARSATRSRREFFATLDSANRYAILYRLEEAKKSETRERRLRKFVGMLERGEKIHG